MNEASLPHVSRGSQCHLIVAFALIALLFGTLSNVVYVHNARQESFPPSDFSLTAPPRMIEYALKEEGMEQGSAFQRYEAIAVANPSTTAPSSISIREWMAIMLESEEALDAFIAVLRQSPYKAFLWETKHATFQTMDNRTLEFVLLDEPRLWARGRRHPQPQVFENNFVNCTASACVFPSLHHKSTLISPQPPIKYHHPRNDTDSEQNESLDLSSYTHLANFCRRVDPHVVRETWKIAIQAYLDHVTTPPLDDDPSDDDRPPQKWYFSTSGLGVTWLHFRVETKPRYYVYRPFRNEA